MGGLRGEAALGPRPLEVRALWGSWYLLPGCCDQVPQTGDLKQHRLCHSSRGLRPPHSVSPSVPVPCSCKGHSHSAVALVTSLAMIPSATALFPPQVSVTRTRLRTKRIFWEDTIQPLRVLGAGDILGDKRPEPKACTAPACCGPGHMRGRSDLTSFVSRRRRRCAPPLPAQCWGQRQQMRVTVLRSSGCPLVRAGERGEAVLLCQGGPHTSAPAGEAGTGL